MESIRNLDLDYIAKMLVRDRLKNGKDIVIAVCGAEGDGKSTLAIELARRIDPAFDLEQNVLYSPNFEEMENKVRGLPRYSAIVVDESIKALYKLNWQSRMSKMMNILYNICRVENKVTLLCLPRHLDLSEYFRNHRVSLWLQILKPLSLRQKEGKFVLLGKTWNFYSRDPWGYDHMQKVIKKYSTEKKLRELDYSFQNKINILAKSPNYIATVDFEHMPDDLFKTYSELKDKLAYDDDTIEQFQNKDNERLIKSNTRVSLLIGELMRMGRTQKEIGEVIGVGQTGVSEMHNRYKPKSPTTLT